MRATTRYGVRFGGYEIHLGVTTLDNGDAAPFARLDDGRIDGACVDGVVGTYLHGALETITQYYAARMDLGDLRPVRGAPKAELAGAIALCPPSALKDIWTRRFPEPVTAFASGWMRVRARARQHGVELPLVVSDHADWDGLCATVAATGASEIWVTHGAEDALVHWCGTRGLAAVPATGDRLENPDRRNVVREVIGRDRVGDVEGAGDQPAQQYRAKNSHGRRSPGNPPP